MDSLRFVRRLACRSPSSTILEKPDRGELHQSVRHCLAHECIRSRISEPYCQSPSKVHRERHKYLAPGFQEKCLLEELHSECAVLQAKEGLEFRSAEWRS